MNNTEIVAACRTLLDAYKTGKLGTCPMPEDAHPSFPDAETQLVYFTLPMSLNYQRDSYKLWEAALKTFNDNETRIVFDIRQSATLSEEQLRAHLTKYKLALQPNKHIKTWQTIAQTVHTNWKSLSALMQTADHDYLRLRTIIQGTAKKGFPYLSGPKIFNYWSFILGAYGGVSLKQQDCIEIAPDTHVTQGSVRLGIITPEESETLSKEELSARWRTLLKDTGITPIQMHPPLWFWSRNGFTFTLPC